LFDTLIVFLAYLLTCIPVLKHDMHLDCRWNVPRNHLLCCLCDAMKLVKICTCEFWLSKFVECECK